MERSIVDSTMIASAGYDPEQKILEVEFTSGAVYRYFDVPEKVYQDLFEADSAGRFFDSTVKEAGYRYEKVRGASSER